MTLTPPHPLAEPLREYVADDGGRIHWWDHHPWFAAGMAAVLAGETTRSDPGPRDRILIAATMTTDRYADPLTDLTSRHLAALPPTILVPPGTPLIAADGQMVQDRLGRRHGAVGAEFGEAIVLLLVTATDYIAWVRDVRGQEPGRSMPVGTLLDQFTGLTWRAAMEAWEMPDGPALRVTPPESYELALPLDDQPAHDTRALVESRYRLP